MRRLPALNVTTSKPLLGNLASNSLIQRNIDQKETAGRLFSAIGRTIEDKQILDVSSSSQAITLTRAGGIRKTMLALHVSGCIRPTFNGDICL